MLLLMDASCLEILIEDACQCCLSSQLIFLRHTVQNSLHILGQHMNKFPVREGLVLPVNGEEINWNSRQHDASTNRCFQWLTEERQYHEEQRDEEEQHRQNNVHLNRPFSIGLLYPKPKEPSHREHDEHCFTEGSVCDQNKHVCVCQVQQTQKAQED